MTSSKMSPLEGIVPPLITPLSSLDELDVAGLERLIEHVIHGGVHGVFILGTTGEGPSISYRLRRELVSHTCRMVNGRVPVLVGITDTSLIEAVALACHAADEGASAVVSSAPYYFPTGQPELIDFVHRLVAGLPIPLFLYNMPQMTKTSFEPNTVKELLDVEGIAGVKDSSGDLNYFRQIVEISKGRPDWRVLMGPESLLVDAMALGGHGGVNGGAQVEPRLLVDLFNAVRAGNQEQVATLRQRLAQLSKIYTIGRHPSTVIKGIKCALSLIGICESELAPPLTKFAAPEREKVRKVLEELNLLPAALKQ